MTFEEIFDNAIEHWRINKGIGTALIPSFIDNKGFILAILERIYSKSDDATTVIVVNDFNKRTELIEYFTHQEDEDNNAEFKRLIETKKIKIFTAKFVENSKYPIRCNLSIVCEIDRLFDKLISLLVESKFKLVVLSNLLSSPSDMGILYKYCPLLEDFKQNEIDAARTNLPVEDVWVSVDLPEDSEAAKLLKYYNEYIATSLAIFGSFDIMQQARVGNRTLNISASEICSQIAYENGWNEHLDMNIEINVNLDELYNPGNIKDRASKTYEIIRERAKLLSDYEGKLDKILNIVKENEHEKILVISKRGEFAAKITEFINTLSEDNICGNYHDNVEPIPAVDLDGNPIFYKSGENAGKRKYMAAKAQKTRNEYLFNKDKLRVLSANNAIDKSLTINVDIIIITSPLCEDIYNFIYRLSNLRFTKNKIKLYSIFVKNSLEEKQLENKPIKEQHMIVNKCKNNVVFENNSDFIVVD